MEIKGNNFLPSYKKGLTIASIFLFLFFIPIIILGNRSFIMIGDNLDGYIPLLHIMALNKQIYSFNLHAQINNMMCGVPRATWPSALNISMLIFSFPDTLYAYIINYIAIHLIAFTGMLLILRTHVLADKKLDYFSIFISLIFAVIPYYTSYSASVAAQPFLLYAFLNILKHKFTARDFIIIFLFPFFSFNMHIGPFIVFSLLVIQCIDFLSTKKLNWYFLGGIGLLTAILLLSDIQLILYSFFEKGFVSHRSEFDSSHILSGSFKWWLILNFIDMLENNQLHIGVFSTIPIILVALLTISAWINRKLISKIPLAIMVSILLICFFYVFYYILLRFANNKFPLLTVFQWNRFYFLLPFLWLLLFALCIKELAPYKILDPFIYLMLFVTLLGALYQNNEFKNNVKQLAHLKLHPDEPNFKQFFAQDQFNDIKNYIHLPQKDYRVVSIGMYPSIALYNGFYTLDGYASSYDVNYKHQFRKVIAGELDKNAEIQGYYDKWGSRCYVFVSELGRQYLYGTNAEKREIKNPAINWKILKGMGCKYLISAVKIDNPDENVLEFQKQFNDPNSYWTIYLYKII